MGFPVINVPKRDGWPINGYGYRLGSFVIQVHPGSVTCIANNVQSTYCQNGVKEEMVLKAKAHAVEIPDLSEWLCREGVYDNCREMVQQAKLEQPPLVGSESVLDVFQVCVRAGWTMGRGCERRLRRAIIAGAVEVDYLR